MNYQTNFNIIRRRPCPNCYLCGAPGELLYQGLEDRLFGAPGEWDLKKCLNSGCGLVWLVPLPSENDIGKAYDVYYTHQGDRNNDRDTGLKGLVTSGLRAAYYQLSVATFFHKEWKRRNLMYLDETTPGKLLDVGCGDGSWLAEMRLSGWEVEGQEIDAKAAQQVRSAYGLKVHLGSLESARIPDNTYDAIIMNHVIEHVYDPITLLAECRRILRPEGILVAVTPNVESFGHNYFASSWFGLDPPRHLHLFSQKTLKTLARKSGFNEFDTWTTTIKAGAMAVGSFDIKREGRHKMRKPIKLRTGIAAAFYHLWAGIRYMKERGSGEECVLRAQKTR